MMKSTAIALLLLAGSAVPAFAANSDEDSAQETAAIGSSEKVAAEIAEENKPVCRTQKITGQRSKVRRLCLTRTEWAALSEQTRKNMDEFYRATNTIAPSISDSKGIGGPPGQPLPN